MVDRPDYAGDITLIDHLVALKLVPDWGAIEAEDIDYVGNADGNSGSPTLILTYTVPAGKTLLIYDWSIATAPTATHIHARLYNVTTALILSYGGAYIGLQTPFSKPKRIDAGETVVIYVIQYSGGIQSIFAHFGGTLI